MVNPYRLLGVSPSASEKEIQNAYREKVKETHPDTGGSVQEFQNVMDAYKQICQANSEHELHTENNQQTQTQPNTYTVEYLDYKIVRENNWSISENAFKQAAEADIHQQKHGFLTVDTDSKTVLGAAEDSGFSWPFSCRGGACANCAVKVITGEMTTPAHSILSESLLNDGFRLSCIGRPVTHHVQLFYNVKEMPELADLLLPSRSDFSSID